MPQDGPLECATHPWNEWSNCSTRCGPGYSQRYRSYKNPSLAASYSCDNRMEEVRQCQGMQCGMENEQLGNGEFNEDANGPATMAECEMSTWSEWSPCSKTCGRGISTRRRDYHNPQARSRCQTVVRMPLEETRQCTGTDCGGTIADNGDLDGLQPESDPFGGTNEAGFENNRPGWNLNNNYNRRPSLDRMDQGWTGNNLATPNYQEQGKSNRRQPYEMERPSGNSYNNDQRSDGYNEYKQNREDSDNDYRQDNRDDSYNDYKQDGRGNSYNNNNYESVSRNNNNNDYSNTLYRGGFGTRAPFAPRYPDRQGQQDAAGSNYNVMQDYCYEKPFASTVPCLANPVIVRNYWFYDHDDHECKIFTTDNCDENNNRFRTLMACEGTCLLPQINLARTDDPEESPYAGDNPYGADTFQPSGGFRGDEGFGQPMAQTRNKYSNVRRGRFGS